MHKEIIDNLIQKSKNNNEVNNEKLIELTLLECIKELEKKALSIYDPDNINHKNKESWDRSLSWAIRDVSSTLKNKFNID